MKVLALEPYFGGSRKAFLEGWSSQSRHAWDVFSLPPKRWRWRIRHAPISFADEVARRHAAGQRWDVIFCSDTLDLAAFRGLLPASLQSTPAVAYFHEDHLTCPVRQEADRDDELVFSNLTNALAATRVWFNSTFHREGWQAQLPELLKRIADTHRAETVERIVAKSSVWPPGINEFPARMARPPGPMRVLWAARWAHDRNPETFFQALKVLKWHGAEFRLSVIGEQFREQPPAFDWARQYFYYHIDWWGYQPNRRDYEDCLAEADVVVSTADHEFFGMSIVEATAAGAFPLVPNRLAYPEIFGPPGQDRRPDFFYGGSVQELADRLIDLADRTHRNDLWQGDPDQGRRMVSRFHWSRVAPAMDAELEQIAQAEAH